MDIQTKKFTKNIEDFTCEHCGAEVKGTGYTNHCPVCLWSKHVDVNPGDRAAACGGLMKPVRVEGGTDNFVLIHECVTCGHTKRNKLSLDDSIDEVAKIAKSAGSAFQ